MPSQDIQNKIRKEKSDWDFPDFIVDEIELKNNKYCICVFVVNEGERVQNQLKKMKKYSSVVDIIVADGGSTDGSLDLKFLKSQNVRVLLTKKGRGKLSAQMRMAFVWALYEEYKGIIVDGNNKDNISAIPDFIKLLDEGYDHIGSECYGNINNNKS
ncbi:MAG: hypothetical protein WCK26_04225 [Candidatus Saccharibacteria bacterium]